MTRKPNRWRSSTKRLARHRWGDEDPLGKRISFDQGRNWVTIVGVVGDVRQYGLNREPTDELYRPVRQTGGRRQSAWCGRPWRLR